MNRTAIALACLLVAGSARAEPTRFVTDQLEIPVRTGKEVGNRIVQMLKAGSPVEVLQRDPDGHSLVRTAKGMEGWVLTRYLDDAPIARDRLAALEEENRSLREGRAQLDEVLATARAELAETRDQAAALGQEGSDLRRELEALRQAAARPLELTRENERLQLELQEARSKLEGMEAEAALLRDSGYRHWFVAGAGVALGGLLLGLVLPRLVARRPRSSWDRL
jgi:SH3 domain protein